MLLLWQDGRRDGFGSFSFLHCVDTQQLHLDLVKWLTKLHAFAHQILESAKAYHLDIVRGPQVGELDGGRCDFPGF